MRYLHILLAVAVVLGGGTATTAPKEKPKLPQLPKNRAYSDAQLKAAGQEWQQIKKRWNAMKTGHQKHLDSIEASNWSPARKQAARTRATQKFHRRSRTLAGRRHQVQEIMIAETNARLGIQRGSGASTELDATLGTGVRQKGHRGMAGDLDAGGGARTTEKMKDVLKDMGFDIKDPKVLVEKPGTIDVLDDFEFTVNKTGMKAKPGTEYHRIETEVNAGNKETYVSESMKHRNKKGEVMWDQPGADYTAVQDHKKKAMKGLKSTPDELVHPKTGGDRMKGMAKGTRKTISDAGIEPDELAVIMKKNGIKGSAQDFQNKLQKIKEGKLSISDPAEAAKIQKASDDVFNFAEKKTLHKARKRFANQQKQIADLDAIGTPQAKAKAQRLRDELADSITKMRTTKRVNDGKMGRKHTDFDPRTTPDVDGPTPKTSRTGKALKVVGAVMAIADIGNAAKTIEKYRNGEISGADAATILLDSSLTLGMIGTTKKAWTSWDDYQKSADAIEQANKTNVVNYWMQWELQLRKAGVSKADAQRLVADAMESGSADDLEHRADELALTGKEIKRPKLVVDTFESDDTWDERAVEVIKGVGIGVYEGTEYIVTAPYRIVKAWGDAEEEIATLEAHSKGQEAYMKARLYQKLRGSGFSQKLSLRALHGYYDGTDMHTLRRIFEIIKKRRRGDKGNYVNAKQRQKDWYCTNRPEITAPVGVPPVVQKK